MWNCSQPQCGAQNWTTDALCHQCGIPKQGALAESVITSHPHVEQPDYRLILGPGHLRYFGLGDFQTLDIEQFIESLRDLSADLRLNVPSDIAPIDQLVTTQSWEHRLRFHHAFLKGNLSHRLPMTVYAGFHRYLRLSQLAIQECLAAWVEEAADNFDLRESFVASPDHLIIEGDFFRKTPFVQTCLQRMQQVEEATRAVDDEQRLRKSLFTTFIYLMEDVRNGKFKIGQSQTPGKRERTLQSEVPEIVMRFSIPSEQHHEKQLHDRFTACRVRGEWFALTPGDVVWIVDFLKQNGDPARAFVDHEWLGRLYFGRP